MMQRLIEPTGASPGSDDAADKRDVKGFYFFGVEVQKKQV